MENELRDEIAEKTAVQCSRAVMDGQYLGPIIGAALENYSERSRARIISCLVRARQECVEHNSSHHHITGKTTLDLWKRVIEKYGSGNESAPGETPDLEFAVGKAAGKCAFFSDDMDNEKEFLEIISHAISPVFEELRSLMTSPCLADQGNLSSQLGSLYKYMQGIDDDVAEQWGQWARELQRRFGEVYTAMREEKTDA